MAHNGFYQDIRNADGSFEEALGLSRSGYGGSLLAMLEISLVVEISVNRLRHSLNLGNIFSSGLAFTNWGKDQL